MSIQIIDQSQQSITWGRGAGPLTPSSSGPGSSRLSQLLLSLRPPADHTVISLQQYPASHCSMLPIEVVELRVEDREW